MYITVGSVNRQRTSNFADDYQTWETFHFYKYVSFKNLFKEKV